ncbi:MAG TPA: hypothetical protein VGL59_12875 [Polyangia bacterium]|jgi:hypothetical protein
MTRGVSFSTLIAGLLLLAVAVLACLMPAQSDTYWALRAGQDIWRTGHIPTVDTYSFTATGRPWPDHEWLWQVLAYGLYSVGGMPLLTAVSAALVVTSLGIVWRLMVGPPSLRFFLMLVAIPLSALVWAPRPQIVTLLLLALLARALVQERYALLPLLFVCWANVHGGVVLGGWLLAATTLAAAARAFMTGAAADRRRLRWLVVTGFCCALGCAVTPMGWGLFRFVLASEERLRQARVNEWLPPTLGFSVDGAVWIVGLAFVLLLAWRWRSAARDGWPTVAVVAGAAALMPLAFRSVRHVGPFLLLAPAAASRLLGADFRWRRAAADAGAVADRPRLNTALLNIAAAAGAVVVALAWSRPLAALGWRPLSVQALAAVRACPDPIYNHYNQGGYLLWFAPEKKVFVDSRQDPYPLPFLLEHLAIESGDAPWQPLFQRYGVRCAILGPRSPTVAALDQAGWRTLYRDSSWSIQSADAAP